MEDSIDEFLTDELDDFDEQMESMTEEEYENEVLWLESIANAIKQNKNVVPNPARYYDFRM